MFFANTGDYAPFITVESNVGRSPSFGNAGTVLPRDSGRRVSQVSMS